MGAVLPSLAQARSRCGKKKKKSWLGIKAAEQEKNMQSRKLARGMSRGLATRTFFFFFGGLRKTLTCCTLTLLPACAGMPFAQSWGGEQ